MIAKSNEAEAFDELVKYLLMVRKQLKDSKVDTELAFAYAKTNQLSALEEFISGTHLANLQSVGDKCAPSALHPMHMCPEVVSVCRIIALSRPQP